MKKREFLAMGGAVPLMLAGCGGDGSGSAPVRLVNASVGYPSLGFMVNTTQAVSDVAYGNASPFETVEAGSVTTALTVPASTADGTVSTVSSTVRSLSKDSRYSLVAYGFSDELKSVLLTESTVAPDSGKANINILNTSVDVGPVDIYLSSTNDGNLALATLIASNVQAVTQSQFYSALPGTYYVTVVGAGSVAQNRSDVRFQSPANGGITVKDQDIVTVILTPGASGTLANAIVLFQGTADAATAPANYLNTTARLRVAMAGAPGTTVTVASTNVSNDTVPDYTDYNVLTSLTVPAVTVNGVAPTFVGAIIPTAATNNQLKAGGDYTLLIYTDSNGANPTASLILDDNTAPVSTSGVKFRLINLAYNNTGLVLAMRVNGITVSSHIGFAAASAYTEVTAPQTTNSLVEVLSNATVIVSRSLVLTAGQIFTEIVVDGNLSTLPVGNFFSSASGSGN